MFFEVRVQDASGKWKYVPKWPVAVLNLANRIQKAEREGAQLLNVTESTRACSCILSKEVQKT